MPGKYYMLVNPYIEGSTPNVFQADNSLKAAKMAYDSISKYFNNSVSKFNISLLKLKSDVVDGINDSNTNVDLKQYGGKGENKRLDPSNFSHFVVKEGRVDSGEVNFTLNKFQGNVQHLSTLVDNIKLIQRKRKNNKLDIALSDDNQKSDSSESIKQDGGKLFNKHKKHDDDDDDDDDDESPDYIKRDIYDPIYYWYYTPSVYLESRLYLPTFVSPLSFPYVVDFYPTATITY